MSNLLTILNTSKKIFNYWIFLYSYNSSSIPKVLDKSTIYIFPFSFYTLFKNRAICNFMSDRPLDLNNDSDLDMILKKYRISNVRSLSEMKLNETTNIICLEIENKNYKRYIKNNYTFFYTYKNKPSYYISKTELLNNDDILYVPQNKDLLEKLKIHISNLGMVTTKVVLNRVFTFLFDELFETTLNKEIIKKDSIANDFIEKSYSHFKQALVNNTKIKEI